MIGVQARVDHSVSNYSSSAREVKEFLRSPFFKGDAMASKAKTIGSTDSTQSGTAVEERERLLYSTGEQEIRDRAHEIYLQRGAQPGFELEDWLQAERELST